MLRVHDYQCSCGLVTEHLVKAGTDTVRCKCGAEAKRIISPVRCSLDPTAGFPGAADKWIRHHEKAGFPNSETAKSRQLLHNSKSGD